VVGSCSIGKPLFSERSALTTIELCKIMAIQWPAPPTFEHENEDENKNEEDYRRFAP
jgi:hypothetical protein